MVVMNIVSEIKHYLKEPNTIKYNFRTPAQKGKAFLQVFLLYLFPVLFLSIITGIIRWIFNIEFKPIKLSTELLLVCNLFIIPFIEELTFRLPLIYNRIYLSISSFFISFFLYRY